jgi:hypothetical protein
LSVFADSYMDSPSVVQRLFHSDWNVWFVLVSDRSRYFNPSKNYWFSFNAFLISLIGLYFRCLSFRVVLVNTARPDGAFLFVVWFIHWKHMIRPFLFIDKQKWKLSIHELVDFWLANVTKLDNQNRFMEKVDQLVKWGMR